MKIKTFFDFCSGIGGGRLGLEQVGLQCVGRSETSRLADTTYCLMHNTENDVNYDNLKKITADKIPAFDLLIAGFPCQTFSVIGRQDGFSDDRGQIIFQLARILRETQPKCFILENVKGLVTHDKGKIDTRMNDLRIYTGKCPTLRAQRDGVLYVKKGAIYQLTGYEALLLQGFPKEYANKVKNEVTDRHLLMQAGNAMTVNVIRTLGNSIINFLNLQL